MANLFQFIVLCVLYLYSLCSNIQILHAYHLCPPDQSLSLLKFKDSLQIDTYKQHCLDESGYYMHVYLSSYCDRYLNPFIESKISSWNSSTDCCSWEGVTCDESTGNVIELDISASRLIGIINSNSSIFQLSHLKKLNLAYNYLDGSEISPVIRRLTNLSHLNLTRSGMQGKVPSEISQLNKLVSLDLTWNDELTLEPDIFKAILQNMTRLRVLSLPGVNIYSSLPNNLSSSLTAIDLAYTYLIGTFPNHLFHLPNLQQLSLGYNLFDDFISLAGVEWNTSSSLEKLELSRTYFQGNLPNIIGNLKHLTYLDISFCDLNGILPQYFENLTQLSHLDLSYNDFSGQIPSAILGLEHLTFLDIRSNRLDTTIQPSAFNNLKRLKVLSLQRNNFTTSVSSFLSNLTQLETIDLAYNSLYQIPLELFELSLLRSVDLSFNNLHGPIPKSFSNLVNLRYLNLRYNNLSGRVETEALSNLVYLEYLNLGVNHFSGSIEKEVISNLVNLEYLNLASNDFTGPFEIDTLANLVNLTTLVLSSNNFNGTVDVKFLSNFKSMNVLDLSHNSLSLINEGNTTLPMILIGSLSLGYCNIWDLDVLRSMVVVEQLSLSNNNIHGEIPEWAWSNWSGVKAVDLSNNFVTHIGSKIPLQSLEFLNLTSNLIQGFLPTLPHSIKILSLSNNQFQGEIKSSICKLREPRFLDLSNNSFSGALPHCIGTMINSLEVLDLHMNNLRETIPEINFTNLVSLNLGANHLEGDLPRSLINCSSLEVLDLSENNLTDLFPVWLGALPKLRVLSFRSNSFYGSIHSPHDSPNDFSQLQILDLSNNKLSGSLSVRLLQKFRGMMSVGDTSRDYFGRSRHVTYIDDSVILYGHDDSMTVVLNGNTMQLERIFKGTTIIDLSCNHFEGEIPNSIGGLVAIQRLNLSHNKFTGQIPQQLGNLSNLLSLDLSSNELDGNIPNQIASLGFLSVMNVSYNHLIGRIPSGQQLQTFPNDSYIGNDGLCGFPLSRSCGNDNSSLLDEEDDKKFFDGFTWQAVLMGYCVGICVGLVLGSLMLFNEKPKWLSRMVKEEANKIIYRYKSRNGISQTWFKRS